MCQLFPVHSFQKEWEKSDGLKHHPKKVKQSPSNTTIMKKTKMKTVCSLFALLALFVTALVLTGCGGGDDPPRANSNTTSTNSASGDWAPDSLDGKTYNGHIGGTTTTWQIVFTGGTYSYAENGVHLDSGGYTYTKTSSTTSVLTLADGTTLQFTYTGPKNGNYLISKSAETGTFTSN